MTAGVTETTPDGLTPEEQWKAVLETARPIFERQSDYWVIGLRPELVDAGVEVINCDDLVDDERNAPRAHFEESVLLTLTPLAFDPSTPVSASSPISRSLAGKMARRRSPRSRSRRINHDSSPSRTRPSDTSPYRVRVATRAPRAL